MADDNSQELRIHIISDADNTGFKSTAAAMADLDKEMGVINVTQADVAAATAKTEEALGKFSFKGREAREIVQELNHAVPELGTAFRALVAEGGPLVLVVLAIKAVTEWWDIYKEHATEAADAQAAATDKMRATLHAMTTAQQEYDRVLAGSTAQADYIKRLEEVTRVLDAQFVVKRKLLELDKETDLAAAKTPEERAAVEDRYKRAGNALDQSGQAADITAITNQRIAVENQITQIEQAVEQIKQSNSGAIKKFQVGQGVNMGFGETPEDAATITHMAGGITADERDKIIAENSKKLEALTKSLEELKKQQDALKDRADAAQKIGTIDAGGRTLENDRPISRAAENFDSAAHGQKLSDAQLAANQVLIQLFSQYSGGIEQMARIVQYHLQHSTTIAAEVTALKTALATLQAQSHSLATQTAR
jgi:hypothetical protein